VDGFFALSGRFVCRRQGVRISYDWCVAIEGLRIEALSGSLSCRRRSSCGKIGQLAEALFGESKI